MADAAMTFYEFFAGGGMARAGFGPEWTCLFANDNDPKKAPPTRPIGTDRGLVVGDVAALDGGRPSRRRRPRLGVIPLPGHLARGRSRGPRRCTLRLVLAVRGNSCMGFAPSSERRV